MLEELLKKLAEENKPEDSTSVILQEIEELASRLLAEGDGSVKLEVEGGESVSPEAELEEVAMPESASHEGKELPVIQAHRLFDFEGMDKEPEDEESKWIKKMKNC